MAPSRTTWSTRLRHPDSRCFPRRSTSPAPKSSSCQSSPAKTACSGSPCLSSQPSRGLRLLDCPPSLGLLTLNALVAANEILVPIQCEYYALEGVSQLMRTIDLVKGELNDRPPADHRLVDHVRRPYPSWRPRSQTRFATTSRPRPCTTVIPRSVRISEAPSYGQTVLTYQPDSAGAVSYLEAAQEIAYRGAEENP